MSLEEKKKHLKKDVKNYEKIINGIGDGDYMKLK